MQERLKITEAGTVCGCSEQSIRRWGKTRGFPERGPDGRYDQAEVLKWAKRHGIRTIPLVRG